MKPSHKKMALHTLAFLLDNLPLWIAFLFYYIRQMSQEATSFGEEALVTWISVIAWILYHLLNELLLPKRKGGTWGQLLLKLNSFVWWRVLISPILLIVLLFWKDASITAQGLRVNVTGQVTLDDLGAKGPAQRTWTEADRAKFHERCLDFMLHSTKDLLGGMDLNLTDELKSKLSPEMKKNCQCQLNEFEKSALGDEFLEKGLSNSEGYRQVFESDENAFEILSITQRCQMGDN